MQGIDLRSFARSISTVLCVGAHPDDIEIGAAGTTMALLEANPDLIVHWAVLSASGVRAEEARCGAERVLGGGPGRVVEVFDHRESYFPYEGREVKETFDGLGRRVSPDLVLTHHRADLHQDHRLVADLTWNTFRDHLILEYEIPKYDGDLGTPNLFVPIDRAICDRKVAVLMETFASQRSRPWFTEETFRATLRLRGIESRSPSGYAEAFHVRKLVLKLSRGPLQGRRGNRTMIFTETELRGAFLIDLEPFEDERGWFARTWDAREFRDRGLMHAPVQTSASHSAVRGTLRGMHHQAHPYEEAKLVRCTRGAVYDVVVDLRPDSTTYLQHVGFVLSEENGRMLYVPEGCAHGFQTLEDGSEVTYQMSREHAPEHARGVRYDDPVFAIRWPLPVTVISERDRTYPDLGDGRDGRIELASTSEVDPVGRELHALVEDLFPITRSITGDGVRETLRRLAKVAPIDVHEVATGTPVFDWTVPKEWNVRDAWIVAPDGERIADLSWSNLHVMSYSTPVRARMPLAELREHLHSLPEQPDRIPYRTSYYREAWGFCLPHRVLERLIDGEYEILIDSTLEDGHLTYGECFVQGESDEEVLVSAHCCHPSLANDNLSGIAVAAQLAKELSERRTRYSYRFLFAPGTIGAITWLSRNRERASSISHGLVLACLGDEGAFTYKRSRRGTAAIDRAVEHVLAHGGTPHRVRDFAPTGYDERQFGSPGFDLPVGSLSRSVHGEFPEYHTSGDDPTFVTPRALARSLDVCRSVVDVLERDRRFRNLYPQCEPQLGRRGLYHAVGGVDSTASELAMLWVLNLSDGDHGLLDVAERSGLPFAEVAAAAAALVEHGLLAAVGMGAGAPTSAPASATRSDLGWFA